MGNVIEFLTRLGEDASLRHASDDALAALSNEAGLDAAVGSAVYLRDVEALRNLLGGEIYFSTQMGEPQREEEEPEDDDGDGDGDGEDGEDEKSRLPGGSTSTTPGSRH